LIKTHTLTPYAHTGTHTHMHTLLLHTNWQCCNNRNG